MTEPTLEQIAAETANTTIAGADAILARAILADREVRLAEIVADREYRLAEAVLDPGVTREMLHHDLRIAEREVSRLIELMQCIAELSDVEMRGSKRDRRAVINGLAKAKNLALEGLDGIQRFLPDEVTG